MSDDRDVSVSISADATGVEAGTAAATAAVEGFGDDVGSISAAILAQTEAMQAGFAELGETITASMTASAAATAEEEAELQGLLGTVKAGVASFNELKETVFGFGEAIMAAFAVEEIAHFVETIGEAGERVQHTAQAFGMTTGEVQRLEAVFTAAGAGPETLGMAMMRLDRAASEAVSGNKRAADAFKDLGVNLAEPMTSAQRMQAVLQGFANIPGPDRAAVAMGVFGRQIMQIAPLLGLSKEQLEEYNASADRFGAVNETAVGHMAALGAALNENKVAMSGLENILGDALSGAFIGVIKDIDDFVASCIQSYQQGGLVRQILQAISTTINTVGVIFTTVGEVFASVWNAFTGDSAVGGQALQLFDSLVIAFGAGCVVVGAAVRIAFDLIGGAINVLEDDFRTLGDVSRDALTLNWGKVTSDYQAGLNRVAAIVQATTAKIKGDLADANASLDQLANPANPSEASPGAAKSTPVKLGGKKNAKKPKDDEVSQWTEQLRQLQDEQANWYQDQNKLAADFWAGIVAKAQGSAKDQQEARDRLAEANKALDAEDTDSAIQAAAKKASAAKGNVDEVRAIYAALEDQLRAKHAEGGDDWKKVEAAKTEAVKKAAEEQIAAQEKVWQLQAKSAEAGIETSTKVGDMKFGEQDKDIDTKQSSGQISGAQALSQHIALVQQQAAFDAQQAQKSYADKVNLLNDEYIAEATNSDKQKEIGQELLAAKEQFDNAQIVSAQQTADRIADLQRAAAEKTRQTWSQNISSVVSTFGNGMLNMAQHGGTLGQVMLKVGVDMEDRFVSAIESMVTKWLTNMALGAVGAQTQAAIASQAQVGKAAETAAANTYAAVSQIPIIGPILAPPAAAAAFVAVEAFASASGGYDIGNENPLTQLHAQEMVLPARYANPLRDQLNAGAFGGGGATAGGQSSGDTHNWNINALDARSVKGWARSGAGKSSIRGAVAAHR